jgi:hypothetical protein
MTKKSKAVSDVNAEIAAIGVVHAALNGLDEIAQARVLSYVSGMLNVHIDRTTFTELGNVQETQSQPASTPTLATEAMGVDAEGINSVALRLIKRSGIEPKELQDIFSLGIDDIDLIAPRVLGDSKRERFHNVLLLKGIASYLGTGAAKVTYEQLKETALHYDAFDAGNVASYLKAFSSDITGSKAAGYTLSPRGLTQGISIVKAMIESKRA